MQHPSFPSRPGFAVLVTLVVSSWAAAVLPASIATAALVRSEPLYVPTSSSPQAMVYLDGSGLTVFWAGYAADETDLWASDGTAAGTRRLQVCPASCGPHFSHLKLAASTSDQAFYWLHDLFGDADLWRTDGTPAGTRRLTFLAPGVDYSEAVWNPAAGLLMFTLTGSGFPEVWVSDGTVAGTRSIFAGGEGFSGAETGFLPMGGRFHFVSGREDASGQRFFDLWSSDGTTAGTRLVTTVGDVHQLGPATVVGGRMLYFTFRASATPGECRSDLRTYDGTAEGSRLVRSFHAGWCSSQTPRIEEVGGAALFTVTHQGDQELWVTDGTAAGTRPLTAFRLPGRQVFWSSPAAYAGELYFAADDGSRGYELWKTSLTRPQPGADLVADLCPGACSALPVGLKAAGGHLYFQAGGAFEPAPWMTDGSTAGTRPRPGFCAGCQGPFVAEREIGGHLYFVGWAGDGGYELFATRTATGVTERLTDLEPFQALDPQVPLTGRPGRVLFAADDGVHGYEPWVTDGSRAGTRLLVDLTPDAQTPDGPPAAPAAPSLTPLDAGGLRLTWEEVAGATRYRFESRQPTGPGEFVREGFGTPELYFTVFLPGTPMSVRVRAENVFGASPWSEWASAATPSLPAGEPCVDSGEVLCLRQGRFRVDVTWRDPRTGNQGTGRTLPDATTDRTGTFWFFKPDNVELIVKILDGTRSNGYWWAFYGALTDVEYWITVTDVLSGTAKTYHNLPEQVCGRGDTTAIGAVRMTGGLFSRAPGTPGIPAAVTSAPATAVTTSAVELPTACVEDGKTLCLQGGRFRVRVEWTDQHNGGSGSGDAIPYADRTGFFTFFNPNNVELVVKILDGSAVNGKVWVFYGALSDVGYTVTVDDLEGGVSRSYVNTPGNICGRADTAAF